MRIVHVASEVAPYSQTGGLAQVTAALPETLALLDQGIHNISVITPLYRCVQRALRQRGDSLGSPHSAVLVPFRGRQYRVAFRSLLRPSGLVIHFLDCPELYDREGIYGDRQGDFDDSLDRIATLCQASLMAATALTDGKPDVFHCHDWPTGLVPVLWHSLYRKQLPDSRMVFTIHNLAYQGRFPKQIIDELRLPWTVFTKHKLEIYDQVSTLKAGIAFAHAPTTVSETYAHEIRSPEFGCGLDGFLRHDCPPIIGIRNGIDVEEWDPKQDPHIAGPFDLNDMAGKQLCRRALLTEYGFENDNDQLLIGVVSRLAEQKGLDLVANIIPDLDHIGARLILVGDGDRNLEDRFTALAKKYPASLAAHIGFDTARAHRVFAGADAFLMPSRFEPCGLGQMAAMRYGSIPIVHAVGGLRDTVDDPGDFQMAAGVGNGFRFEHAITRGLRWALSRCARLYRTEPTVWKGLMHRAMSQDWSWEPSAKQYLSLYRELR